MNRDPEGGNAPARRRFPLYAQILVGMLLGLLLGPLLGSRALILGTLGKIVVQLIKAAATPLLFFAIVQGRVERGDPRRAALRLLFFATLNACIALGIGLGLSNLFHPGRSLASFSQATSAASAGYANKKLELMATLESFVPSNFVTPFAENSVADGGAVGAAVRLRPAASAHRAAAFGLAGVPSRRRRRHYPFARARGSARLGDSLGAVRRVRRGGQSGWRAWLRAAPGPGNLRGRRLGRLAAARAGQLPGPGWCCSRACRSAKFWKAAREPVVYALGANSSLATLPVTLRALDRLGVPRSASTLGACVGTNFNNDGIILYEGMAVLFVAQASGIHVSFGEQLLVAGALLGGGHGRRRCTGGGFVSLALVLNTVKLPLELLPLLLTVDWIIARGRSAVNVLSDMLLSILLAKGEREPT